MNRRQAEEERVREVERDRKKVEAYKLACRSQLEENKQMRETVMQKEFDEENKPPQGNDLMQVLYNVKPHQAYARRERNDLQLKTILAKLEGGSTSVKVKQEQKAMAEYVSKKEVLDKKEDESRLRRLKRLEQEMKRTLDIQTEEKGVAKQLQKYADSLEQKEIHQKYEEYLKTEHKTHLSNEKKVMKHQE